MDLLNGETGAHLLIAIAAVGLALAAYTAVLKFLRDRPISPLMQLGGRERTRRLMVVDAAVIDTKRRVVLIRRDNVEHLVLIGGPTDVVIESRIAERTLQGQSAASQQQTIQHAARQAIQREQRIEADLEELPDLAEAPRPQPRREERDAEHLRQLAAERAAREAAERAAREASMPSDENNYTYGPDAALSAREFEVEQPQAQSGHRPEAAQTASEANADAIIEMLRSRILGEAAATAAARQPAPAPAPEPAAKPREESPFARVLANRMQQPVQPQPEPSARVQRTWAAAQAATAAARAAAPQPQVQAAPAQQPREKARGEIVLEMEVARILEELQQRRRQKNKA